MLAESVLEQLDTPCYLYDLDVFERDIDAFASAFSAAWRPGEVLTCYSVKTAPVMGLLRIAHAHGWCAEVVSDEEYAFACECGFAAHDIVFNGPMKSREVLVEALCDGAIVNLDSWREVRWACECARDRQEGRRLRVGLRVKSEQAVVDTGLDGNASTRQHVGFSRSRFGFDVANGELGRAVRELRAAGIEPYSLHIHLTYRAGDRDAHGDAAHLIAAAIAKLHLDALGLIDMGGGYFGGGANRDRYAGYAQEMAAVLRQTVDPARCALAAEPGGSILACAGSLVGRVVDVRAADEVRFVTTELSKMYLNPTTIGSSARSYELYRIADDDAPVTDGLADQQSVPLQVVGGFTCMEQDRILELQGEAPLCEGDLVRICNVGAYALALAPHFFIRHAPPCYGVCPDGTVRSLDR